MMNISVIMRYPFPSTRSEPVMDGPFMKNFTNIKNAVEYVNFNFSSDLIAIFIDTDNSEIIDSDEELLK